MRALVQAVEAGAPVLDGCARLRPLHRSALLSVDLWRCEEDGEGLRAERSHPLPVLTVLLSGASVLEAGDRAVILEEGTAVLARDLTYRSAHPFGCGDTGCHVRPSPLLLRELRLPGERCTVFPLTPRAHLRLRRAVERTVSAGADGLELEEACLAVLNAAPHAGLLGPVPTASRRHAALVEEAKALLLRRFAEPLSLAELAEAAGSSPFHLARLFRRHTGFSLHGYRTRVRLLHALDRLEESRGALADLALELGFSSQSHFTDAFTRVFGVPPGAVGKELPRPAV